VLYGALCGRLEEAAVLAVLRSSQPMPLKREPNKQLEYRRLIAHYGPLHAEQEQDTFKEDEMLANLAAYLAFQRRVLDPRRLRRVRRPSVNANMELEGESVLVSGLKNRPELNGERVEVGKYDAARGRYAVTLGSGEMVLLRGANLIEAEAEWCRERKISHTALLATTRTVDHVLRRVFHFFPPVLRHHLERRASRPAPTHATHDFAALESMPESKQRGGGGSIFRLLVDKRAETLLRKLLQTLRPPQDRHTESAATPSDANGPCFFYRRGCCSVEPCPFGHEVSADTRPLCKFALSGTCRFGAARCRFRHPNAKTTTQQDPEVTAIQRQVQLGLGGSLMSMFAKVETVGAITSGPEANCKPAPDYLNFQSVLLLGEGDFTFAAELASAAKSNTLRMLRPHAIIATTLQSNAKVLASHPKRASLAIAELQSAGSSVCFCFDAQEIDTSDLGPGLECVVWNMPFAADVLPGESVKSDPNQPFNIDGFTDERRSYLVADLDVLCSADDDEYRGLDAYFWTMFALWPVLVPLTFLALLLSIRSEVRAQRSSSLARACRFLFRDYDPGFLFWEVVDLGRKLFLASLVLFIQTNEGSSKLLRLVVASVVSGLYLAALALARPFKRADDLYLACTANLLLMCCFCSAP